MSLTVFVGPRMEKAIMALGIFAFIVLCAVYASALSLSLLLPGWLWIGALLIVNAVLTWAQCYLIFKKDINRKDTFILFSLTSLVTFIVILVGTEPWRWIVLFVLAVVFNVAFILGKAMEHVSTH